MYHMGRKLATARQVSPASRRGKQGSGWRVLGMSKQRHGVDHSAVNLFSELIEVGKNQETFSGRLSYVYANAQGGIPL